jgi:hypothetical protein
MTNHHSAIDLLLCCLSDSRGPTADSREPTTDWNKVVDLAVYHGLAPLLFKRLKRSDTRAGIPADAWERLRLVYFVNADTNMRLYRELRTVLRCLRGSGIPVIVLKGVYLAETVYGDIALRQMCDADLMVPRAELPRAQAVLLDMGGVPEESEDIESCCRERPHLPPVVIRDLAVEIHWTIASPTGPVRIDAAGLWDRARRTSVAGVEVLALSPEDLLLHLCLHFCYQHRLEDGQAGLKAFCDITETIHRFRGEMDWLQVARLAREWGATRYVGLTLHLVGSMFGVRVPEEVLERLVLGGLDQHILEMARESVTTQMSSLGCATRPVRDLWGTKSIGDKARLLWQRVFCSREEMAKMYPASRDSKHFYFFYALRLRDVLRYHGASVPRIMLSREIRQSASKMIAVTDWLKSGGP